VHFTEQPIRLSHENIPAQSLTLPSQFRALLIETGDHAFHRSPANVSSRQFHQRFLQDGEVMISA
jgi:hypothetical protein